VRAGIVNAPLTFSGWGNFFEQFTLVTGAALVWAPEALRRIGRILVGVCALSFALYQAFYLQYTATLVPAWLPPSQMFWTVATTVAFALAALALLIDRLALLATRLMTAMIVGFGLLVWVPKLLADPRSHSNWNEFVENFAIAGRFGFSPSSSATRRRTNMGHGHLADGSIGAVPRLRASGAALGMT